MNVRFATVFGLLLGLAAFSGPTSDNPMPTGKRGSLLQANPGQLLTLSQIVASVPEFSIQDVARYDVTCYVLTYQTDYQGQPAAGYYDSLRGGGPADQSARVLSVAGLHVSAWPASHDCPLHAGSLGARSRCGFGRLGELIPPGNTRVSVSALGTAPDWLAGYQPLQGASARHFLRSIASAPGPQHRCFAWLRLLMSSPVPSSSAQGWSISLTRCGKPGGPEIHRVLSHDGSRDRL